MIEENAIVTEQLGGQVRLEIIRRTACGICGQTRGCGNATWGKMLGHAETTLQVDNAINAQVGDHVVVGIEEKAFLNATFLLYVVPLCALFAGALLAQVFFNQDSNQDIYVMLGALLGLGAGFLAVKALTNVTPTNATPTRWAIFKPMAFKYMAQQPYAVILRRADQTAACQP